MNARINHTLYSGSGLEEIVMPRMGDIDGFNHAIMEWEVLMVITDLGNTLMASIA